MSTTEKPTRKAYVVQAFGWDYNDEYHYRGGENDDRPLKAFTSREKAEAYRRELEESAREGECPFEWNSLWPSTLTPKQVVKVLSKLGLAPPRFEFGCYQWHNWWADHVDGLTDKQIGGIWDAMDEARFFEVVEIEVED